MEARSKPSTPSVQALQTTKQRMTPPATQQQSAKSFTNPITHQEEDHEQQPLQPRYCGQPLKERRRRSKSAAASPQHDHALFDTPPGRLLQTQLHASATPHFTSIPHFSPSTVCYPARLKAFYNAIALQSIHLFQNHCIIFSTTHPCRYIYSYVFTPGLSRKDTGVFLAHSNGPEYATLGHRSAYSWR